MKLVTLCESLNKSQLDRIIEAVKLMLSEKTFTKAIWHEMNRFGYTGSEIFRQIAAEMRRRSSSRSPGRRWTDPYNIRVMKAAKWARDAFIDKLSKSPNVDDIDQFDFIDAAAEKFGVATNAIIGAGR